MTRAEALLVLATLKGLPAETLRLVLRRFPAGALEAVREEWWWQAHQGQFAPEGKWNVWAIVAGRGFGKTRAGAEWVWARARENGDARIALVGASLEEVARVMVEGESGLLSVARGGEAPRWTPSRGVLRFPSGATGFAYSAERPRMLRGPQHHFAWCDELAKWPRGAQSWDNLQLGMRLGELPRTVVTTTPQPIPLLRRILALSGTARTAGRTDENPNLPAQFHEAMSEMYGGSRLGRQELEGVLFEDFEGALWTREMLDGTRLTGCDRGGLKRVVVGVDPPASASGDGCGIVVCGIDDEGVALVLADLSAGGLRPEGWARRVAAAAEDWGAVRIVAEKNQGGDMVESVLRGVESTLPVKLVAATSAKAARAEPVALRWETGRARLAGFFPELEDEMCAMTYAGYQGPGSPDRADAMVWAMSELIGKPKGEPRIGVL